MEFKGTKGKWYLGIDVMCLGRTLVMTDIGGTFICDVYKREGTNQHKANAQLIVHAPEMLERLKEQNIDLEILKSNLIEASKSNTRFEGYPEQVQKWIDANNELIKSATEIK